MHRCIFTLFFILFSASGFAGAIENSLRHQLEKAHSTYLKGNYESRQQAMLSLSKILESTDIKVRNKAVGKNALAVTYIRLGILAKENNDVKLAGQYFNQGLASFHQSGGKLSLEELVETTHNLDNFARQYGQRN